MDGGVLVPAHTKDFIGWTAEALKSRDKYSKRDIFESGFLFVFFLQLSSFETNANYANGAVMTTLPVRRSRNPGESLTPDVPRVLFNETRCSRLCTKPPKYTLTGSSRGRWEKKREMNLLTTECGVFSARESRFLEREPQDSFVTCIFNALDSHLILLYLRLSQNSSVWIKNTNEPKYGK